MGKRSPSARPDPFPAGPGRSFLRSRPRSRTGPAEPGPIRTKALIFVPIPVPLASIRRSQRAKALVSAPFEPLIRLQTLLLPPDKHRSAECEERSEGLSAPLSAAWTNACQLSARFAQRHIILHARTGFPLFGAVPSHIIKTLCRLTDFFTFEPSPNVQKALCRHPVFLSKAVPPHTPKTACD